MAGNANSRAAGFPGSVVIVVGGRPAATAGPSVSQPRSNSSGRRSAIIGSTANIGQNACLFGFIDLPAKVQIETLAGLAPHAQHAHVPVAGLVDMLGWKLRPVKRGTQRRRHAATFPELLPFGVELQRACLLAGRDAPVRKVEVE